MTRELVREMVREILNEIFTPNDYRNLLRQMRDLKSKLMPSVVKLSDLLPIVTAASSFYVWDCQTFDGIAEVQEWIEDMGEDLEDAGVEDFMPMIQLSFGDAPSNDYNEALLFVTPVFVADVLYTIEMTHDEFTRIINDAESLDDLPGNLRRAINRNIDYQDDVQIKPSHNVDLDIY